MNNVGTGKIEHHKFDDKRSLFGEQSGEFHHEYFTN